MKESIDIMFKIFLMTFGLIFLFLFYNFSLNGRYIYKIEKISDLHTERYVVDSNTGKIYAISYGLTPGSSITDYLNGTISYRDLTVDGKKIK